MSRIGHSFGSYTYTDSSAASFPDIQERYKDHQEKFIYQVFDIEGDVSTSQGLVESGYDVVIVPNGLHATKDVETTLTALRKLLKPGGRLVLLEFTDVNPVRPTFVLGSIASWWVGETDEGINHPLLPQNEWDAVMRKTGFSGIDSAAPETRFGRVPVSLMLSQAVDKQIKLIREPLNADNAHDLGRLPKLVIVAGSTASTAQLQTAILAFLEPFCSEVDVVERLELLQESHFGPKQLVLSLTELDEPTMDPLTPEKWAALQLMTEKALNVLWLTRGAAGGENPFSNMMVAIGRCMVHERPELRLQCVDFGLRDAVDPRYVAETLLRMHIASTWKGFTQPYVPAWVLEREIRVVEGQPIIPRAVPCTRLDNRYNSTRRTIRAPVSLDSSVVAVETQPGAACELREVKIPAWAVAPQEHLLQVRVHRTSLAPLAIPSVGSLYLVVGSLTSSSQNVLAFAESQQSVVSVPKHWVVSVDVPDEKDTSLLVAAANLLMAHFFLSNVADGTSLLVHESSRLAAAALKTLSVDHNIGLNFTTSTLSPENDEVHARYIHHSASRRTIHKLLPANLSSFVDLSSLHNSAYAGGHIKKQLDKSVRNLALADYFVDKAHIEPSASSEAAWKLLRHAYAFFETQAHINHQQDVIEIPLAAIPGYKRDTQDSRLAVVSWSEQATALVKLAPPEDIVRFRPDKTYWLAGLTGELGLSLTRWMVQRGARYVVLTSRKPAVDQEWLKTMKAAGATIATLPM
jgi:SAM-dependent methyltransferase